MGKTVKAAKSPGKGKLPTKKVSNKVSTSPASSRKKSKQYAHVVNLFDLKVGNESIGAAILWTSNPNK